MNPILSYPMYVYLIKSNPNSLIIAINPLNPSQSTLKYGSENRPWVTGLNLQFELKETNVQFLLRPPLPPSTPISRPLQARIGKAA